MQTSSVDAVLPCLRFQLHSCYATSETAAQYESGEEMATSGITLKDNTASSTKTDSRGCISNSGDLVIAT